MQAIPNENEVDKVENFINAHLRDDLGITDFELDIQFVSLFDYATNLNMDLVPPARHGILFTPWVICPPVSPTVTSRI